MILHLFRVVPGARERLVQITGPGQENIVQVKYEGRGKFKDEEGIILGKRSHRGYNKKKSVSSA